VAQRFRLPFQGRAKTPATTGGRVIYAVGDVHGRCDLLSRLLDEIERDRASLNVGERPVLVFVGDYVDRGADSRGVVERVIRLREEDRFELRTLKGNHEEALLEFLRSADFGPTWAEYGGLQTLASYGVTPPLLRSRLGDWESARQAFEEAVPRRHLAFLASLELMASYGDYTFVHAGVRPGVPLSAQREHDLLWIREEFLLAPGPFGSIIVHGHTPEPEPVLGQYRIGIDTGAYATGVLTAVRLNDAERVILQTRVRADA
jgi:serine/threonine protein phosphatase 1